MNHNTAEFQYVTGQMRESFVDVLASFEAQNVQALSMPNWELDIPYGAHVREVMDVRPSDAMPLGTVVYFHAGYWQSRDKSQFRFLVPAFNAMGWDMALVNYPLCPEVGVARIVESAAQALQQLLVRQRQSGRHGPIVLCGHSAGAHLAVELALKHLNGLSALQIAGVIAISGLYDLDPLRETSLNTRLKLDASSARDSSPIHRVKPGAAPALFLWGDDETPVFHAQSQSMARLWQMQGNEAKCCPIDNADHFSVLEKIFSVDSLLAHPLKNWSKK
jgi:arylformamidase